MSRLRLMDRYLCIHMPRTLEFFLKNEPGRCVQRELWIHGSMDHSGGSTTETRLKGLFKSLTGSLPNLQPVQ